MPLVLPGSLVEPAWVEANIGHPDLVVADSRWYPDGSARSRYEDAHIPGAVFVDVDADLAAPRQPGGGRHPLPAQEAFAEAMGRLGIGDRSVVVAYDDAGGAYAARLWWMLDVTGHSTAILDGGLQAWPGRLEGGRPAERGRVSFTARPWPEDAIVDADAVERLRHDPDALVLDVRAQERYRGESEPIDPVPGHVPGARSSPFVENLDPATGRLLRPDQLLSRFQAVGADRAKVVAVYCGSGVTSCHHVLAMERAGLPRPRVYVGSWSEWVADPGRPVATGTEAGGAGYHARAEGAGTEAPGRAT